MLLPPPPPPPLPLFFSALRRRPSTSRPLRSSSSMTWRRSTRCVSRGFSSRSYTMGGVDFEDGEGGKVEADECRHLFFFSSTHVGSASFFLRLPLLVLLSLFLSPFLRRKQTHDNFLCNYIKIETHRTRDWTPPRPSSLSSRRRRRKRRRRPPATPKTSTSTAKSEPPCSPTPCAASSAGSPPPAAPRGRASARRSLPC